MKDYLTLFNLVIVLMFTFTIRKCTAIKCYSCDSRDSKDINYCDNAFVPTSKMITECPSQCIILKLFLKGTNNGKGEMEEVTKRFCGLEEMSICHLMKEHLQHDEDVEVNDCTSCESDFCNGPECSLDFCQPTQGYSLISNILMIIKDVVFTVVCIAVLSVVVWFGVKAIAPKIAQVKPKDNIKDTSVRARYQSENLESQVK